ncbi:fungal-specific transcription factor domain-containing protein [Aspergillus pseudonomiae]|uniref:Fungal-specific transcription factor domain-containing protein n=1 Tax=Aspergillus pseudonomiae TaxID=1506151 RepID=A0A5N7DGE5_9EURO|nr:fungal-specific transcription factor domain-containing protein [Aspergillus pseudonomiae]KAE8405502.1 fungal-specific transcription factor domain-containing protein [Aspergillus pseudonomiae]
MSETLPPNPRRQIVGTSTNVLHAPGARRTRRAPLACQHCRRRKVRCNLAIEGPPCVNCRLDGFTCLLPPRKLPRCLKPRLEAHSDHPPESMLVDRDQDINDAKEQGDNNNTSGLRPAQRHIPTSGPRDSISSTLVPYAYYPYLNAPNLHRLPASDITFLDSQKCFSVPSGEFLETLISHYFLYVHPCLPVINEAEFWPVFRQRERHKHFSLLVFQAMLFVASSYLPVEYVKRSGVQSIIALRDTFYRRAKLIYDFELENDQLRLGQAAVLLTYRCSSTDRLSNTTWLALGIQHARAVKAHVYHRYPTNERAARVTLKRLWWCLILRDRLLSLGVRRALQILPCHFDVSSHSPLTYEDLEDEVKASEVYDAATKKRLIEVVTSQFQLAATMTLLLMTVYPPGDHQSLGQGLDLVPARTDDLKERLQFWESNHMVQVDASDGQWHQAVVFYCQLTSLYYQSARLVLYHYVSFCLFAQKNLESTAQDLEDPELDLMDALTTMNDRVKRFVIDGTAGQLPIGVVAYTVAPQILLNINLRLCRNDIERQRQEQPLRFYTEISRLYNIRYDVEYISAWIRNIVRTFEFRVSHGGVELLKQRNQPVDTPSQSAIATANRCYRGGLSELLSRQPSVYFELVAVVDYFMSTGRGAFEAPSSIPILPSIQCLPLYQEPNLPLSLPVAKLAAEQPLAEQTLLCPEMENLHEEASEAFDSVSLDGMWLFPASIESAEVMASDNEGIQMDDMPFTDDDPVCANSIWHDLGLCGE